MRTTLCLVRQKLKLTLQEKKNLKLVPNCVLLCKIKNLSRNKSPVPRANLKKYYTYWYVLVIFSNRQHKRFNMAYLPGLYTISRDLRSFLFLLLLAFYVSLTGTAVPAQTIIR
jgi:hypothetical protein